MSAAAGSPWRRRLRIATLGVVAAVLVTAGYFARQVILVGNGYVAKTVCSGVFVSGRKPQGVLDAEIRLNDPGICVEAPITAQGYRVDLRARPAAYGPPSTASTQRPPRRQQRPYSR